MGTLRQLPTHGNGPLDGVLGRNLRDCEAVDHERTHGPEGDHA